MNPNLCGRRQYGLGRAPYYTYNHKGSTINLSDPPLSTTSSEYGKAQKEIGITEEKKTLDVLEKIKLESTPSKSSYFECPKLTTDPLGQNIGRIRQERLNRTCDLPTLSKSDYLLPEKPEKHIGVEHSMNKSAYGLIAPEMLPPHLKPEIDIGVSSDPIGDTDDENKNAKDQENINAASPLSPSLTAEATALKGLKKVRTSNQIYGSWINHPLLEGDWYNSPRFPQVQTYMTRFNHSSPKNNHVL